MAKKKKSASSSKVRELLEDVKESMSSSPKKAMRSQKGQPKSKYEDHPKFAKFKKEGN